jgi:hypothetical protein
MIDSFTLPSFEASRSLSSGRAKRGPVGEAPQNVLGGSERLPHPEEAAKRLSRRVRQGKTELFLRLPTRESHHAM